MLSDAVGASEERAVDLVIDVLENIEDHLRVPSVLPHRVHGDFGGFFIWEMKFPGGNAAECHARDSVLPRQFQTGTVAGGKQLPVYGGHAAVYDRADGMEDIIAGQIVGGREFGLPGGFLMSLFFHDFGTSQPKLHSGIGVDHIVDAAVTRSIAAGHAAIGGVHNGAAFQRSNISLPEVDPRLYGCKVGDIRNAFPGSFLPQICVLHRQKILAGRQGAGGHSSESAAAFSAPPRPTESAYPDTWAARPLTFE